MNTDPEVHAAHVASGENHWFDCGLCDDEAAEVRAWDEAANDEELKRVLAEWNDIGVAG